MQTAAAKVLLMILLTTVSGSIAMFGCQFEQALELSEEQKRYEDDGLLVNKNLRLMTPEQFFRNVRTALKFEDSDKLERLQREYGVALGGVDFRVAFKRNRVPSGQSQLSIRRISWDIADEVVRRDVNAQRDGDRADFLNIVRIAVDRPTVPDDYLFPPEILLAIEEGEKRFIEQLRSIYWQLLSRPATDAEIKLMTQTFSEVVASEKSAEAGWKVLLYMVLASMEYWNI